MMGLAFIKHLRLELCHVFAYLWLWVSEKVTVMVLVGQRGFWDVSLTLGPGTVSDHSNGLEHWEGVGAVTHQSHPQWKRHWQIDLRLLTFLSLTDNG